MVLCRLNLNSNPYLCTHLIFPSTCDSRALRRRRISPSCLCPEAKGTLKSNTYQANMHSVYLSGTSCVEGGRRELGAEGRTRRFRGLGIVCFISPKPLPLCRCCRAPALRLLLPRHGSQTDATTHLQT